MYKKGDLVYIPADTALEKEQNATAYFSENYSRLEVPSLGVIIEDWHTYGLQKLFIPNKGFWYVNPRNIYESKTRREINEISSSRANEQYA